MKTTSHSHKTFSAPICISLCGDDVAAYGRPALMLALNRYVTLTPSDESQYEHDEHVQKLYSLVRKYAQAKTPSELSFEIHMPFNSSYRSVQSAIIVCLSAYVLFQKFGKAAPITEVQKVAYAAEKEAFQQYSHAQTVSSSQGGLIYYRKEFEFYKTIVKLPMKLPDGFLNGLTIAEPKEFTIQPQEYSPEYSSDQERICKRLVFAVTQERKIDWRESLFFRIDSSDLYLSEGKENFQEDHKGFSLV